LELGTAEEARGVADNLRDSRGRHRKQQLVFDHQRRGMTAAELARKYDLPPTTVRSILKKPTAGG
jgi:Mor family transcriptional regulator